ncbi:MAG: outer membrane beta-barrel protein [Terracidiphilus sp.]
MSRKRSVIFFLALFVASVACCDAQVAPSAVRRQFTVTAGGLGSLFRTDYGSNNLFGVGAFVDVKFTRWVQAEAEGRWLRFNQAEDVWQDNYLIGPRVPIHTFGRITPYGKVLVGMGSMNFQYNYAYGRFTDIAYGGGLDVQLTRRIAVRPIDFEYQQWPHWVDGALYPWGFSAGVSYRVFGGR